MKTVLFCILNWGLGHATRCIPIIKSLQRNNAKVIVASDGSILQFLEKELDEVVFIMLPAYNISYRSKSMLWNITTQSPKILQAIVRENIEIKKITRKNKIDFIISDNRFGCFHKKIHSIYISHQINLIIPSPLLQNIANQINHFIINKYKECWIPDFKDDNISGKLSQPACHQNTKYLGVLSRLKPGNLEIKYDLLVLLSGPEPQRSILESILFQQCENLKINIAFVRGVLNKENSYPQSDNITIFDYLNTKELNNLMLKSEVIVSRSGYSTLMDISVLAKKAILIPTPGQTEQEYLADNCQKNNYAVVQAQDSVNIVDALAKSKKLSGFPKRIMSDDMDTIVAEALV